MLNATLAAAALAACGEEPAAPKAAFEVKVYAKASAKFTGAKFTVLKTEAHVVSPNDAGKPTPLDGSIDADALWTALPTADTVDLSVATDPASAMPVGRLETPEGRVNQFRFTLDASSADLSTVTTDAGACQLNLSKLKGNTFQIGEAFKPLPAFAQKSIVYFLEFDMDASFVPDEDGDCYFLQPLVRVGKATVDNQDVSVR